MMRGDGEAGVAHQDKRGGIFPRFEAAGRLGTLRWRRGLDAGGGHEGKRARVVVGDRAVEGVRSWMVLHHLGVGLRLAVQGGSLYLGVCVCLGVSVMGLEVEGVVRVVGRGVREDV